ncbi:MAG: hypothetical protein K2G40_05905 [Muribaculaceae bacterium]|nr:hypothetical protein [Muribaculaceae bacterium]
MRKSLLFIFSLLSIINIFAQSTATDAKTLVITTIDGTTTKFNIADIKELSFEGAPAPATSTITRLLNLSPEFISITGLEENQTLDAGEEATLTIQAGTILSSGIQDYHFEHLHIQVNDKIIVPQVPENYTPADEIKVTFTLPAGECEIVVCYSIQQQLSENGFTMTLEENPNVKLYGVSPDCKYKYFDAYLLVNEAYVITDAEFKMGDGNWTSVNDTAGCSVTPDETVANLYHICIRPDYQDVTGNIVLRVSGKQHHRYDITWSNAIAKYVDLEKSTFPSQAIDGNQVTAEIYVKDDFYLNGASASDNTVVNVYQRAYVQFIMPAGNVNITLDFLEKIPVTYVESPNVTEAAIYNAPDIYYGWEVNNGIPGEKVYVIATAAEGYKPMTASIGNGTEFKFRHYGAEMYVCDVDLPADATDVEVTVACAQAWSVSSPQKVVCGDGTLYTKGETVSFTIEVPEGKKIDSVTATTSLGKEIDLTLDLPYGSFTMPADDVEIVVIYGDIEEGDTVSVIATFDEDQYIVSSTTNYDWDFAEGFNIDKGSTFYLSVYDNYGESFYVGIKIGDTVEIYPALEDEESGEYTFGKAIIANGDIQIKVGANESSVQF